VDFNVLLTQRKHTSDNRIVMALPTIKNIVEKAAGILMSHRRPDGEKNLSSRCEAGSWSDLASLFAGDDVTRIEGKGI
jgi:3-phosphoglycerate kinase